MERVKVNKTRTILEGARYSWKRSTETFEHNALTVCDGVPIELQTMWQKVTPENCTNFNQILESFLQKLINLNLKEFKLLYMDFAVKKDSYYFSMIKCILENELENVRKRENELKQLLEH